MVVVVVVPADELDDRVVFEAGVGWAGISSFIQQLHHVILVRELPGHLTSAHRGDAVFDANSCSTTQKVRQHIL